MGEAILLLLLASTCFVDSFRFNLDFGTGDIGNESRQLKRLVSAQMANRENPSRVPNNFIQALKTSESVDSEQTDSGFALNVRSSGINSTGKITLEASLDGAAKVYWRIIIGQISVYTKGDRQIKDNEISTKVVVSGCKTSCSFWLLIETSNFNNMVALNRAKVLEGGEQNLLFKSSMFVAPEVVNLDETGKAVFDVILPPFILKDRRRMLLLYRYVDECPRTFESFYFGNFDSSEGPNGSLAITIKSTVKAKFVYYKFLIIVEDQRRNNEMLRMSFLMKSMIVVRHNNNTSNDVVKIIDMVSTYIPNTDGTVLYGSVICIALGNPKPSVEIYRNGDLLEHSNIDKIMPNTITAVVNLEGMAIEDAQGAYNCTARSGNVEDTRSQYLLDVASIKFRKRPAHTFDEAVEF